MSAEILSVNASSSEVHAGIVAIIDGDYVCRFNRKRGWRCGCPDDECPHIDEVADLIHQNTLDKLGA